MINKLCIAAASLVMSLASSVNATAQFSLYKLDSAHKSIEVSQASSAYLAINTLQTPPRLVPRCQAITLRGAEWWLDRGHRNGIELLRREIKRLPRGPEAREKADAIANAWVGENLSEDELRRLDLFRFETGVERYGAFVFESKEACTIAKIPEANALRAQLKSMRLDLIETMETISAKRNAESISNLLGSAALSKLQKIVAAKGQ